MGETALIIITALFSGIIATMVTLWWQDRAKKKENKEKIFSVLMSKRYNIADMESVDALNMIDAVFYSDKKVREAWKKFKEATDLSDDKPDKTQIISDKHLKLLETIAESIGYKDIKWDDIKNYYYPVALSTKLLEENLLRKSQLDLNIKQVSNKPQTNETSQVPNELMGQAVIEALKNPDGFVKLVEASERLKKK